MAVVRIYSPRSHTIGWQARWPINSVRRRMAIEAAIAMEGVIAWTPILDTDA